MHRSMHPGLFINGCLKYDATHKCVLKFGSKDFPLIAYATVDIQRKAHRVG